MRGNLILIYQEVRTRGAGAPRPNLLRPSPRTGASLPCADWDYLFFYCGFAALIERYRSFGSAAFRGLAELRTIGQKSRRLNFRTIGHNSASRHLVDEVDKGHAKACGLKESYANARGVLV